MQHFGWHTDIFKEFGTYVEQEVGFHKSQVHDQYMVAWYRVRVDLVSYN
jgi:hypothetical protein